MERLSALMDGELHTDEARRELSRLDQDPQWRERWDTFHLIGDAMRGQGVLTHGLDARVAASLAHEPTVLAPRRTIRRIPTAVSYAFSAAASLSAVAAVAWVALSGPGEQPNLAQVQAPAAVVVPGMPTVPAIAADAATTHDYLLAHQGVSPSTALQGVAPYVRTVTMNQQIDGR